MSETKTCRVCGAERPNTTEYFGIYIKKNGEVSLRPMCIGCITQKQRESSAHWREKNREELNAQDRAKYWSNPEKHIQKSANWNKNHKQRHNENERKFYENNKERLAREKREYRAQHPDKVKQAITKYNSAHPEQCAETKMIRRNSKHNVPINYSVAEWEECKCHFDYQCAYCGAEKKLCRDHFVPLVRGGPYISTNIVPSCKNCNSSKYTRPFEIWYPNSKHYDPERENKIIEWVTRPPHDT